MPIKFPVNDYTLEDSAGEWYQLSSGILIQSLTHMQQGQSARLKLQINQALDLTIGEFGLEILVIRGALYLNDNKIIAGDFVNVTPGTSSNVTLTALKDSSLFVYYAGCLNTLFNKNLQGMALPSAMFQLN